MTQVIIKYEEYTVTYDHSDGMVRVDAPKDVWIDLEVLENLLAAVRNGMNELPDEEKDEEYAPPLERSSLSDALSFALKHGFCFRGSVEFDHIRHVCYLGEES